MTENKHLVQKKCLRRRVVIRALGFGLVLLTGTWFDPEFWRTADQRGDSFLQSGNFSAAAKTYSDPLRIGIAQYRNGDFKEAAQTFARVPGAVGAFNQGTALLMHGAYEEAIAAFDRALAFRPGWQEAEDNEELAVARRDKLAHSGDGAAVAPEDKPSEITFDLSGENKRADTVDLAQGDGDTDAAFRATWLRRVQTTPTDFLRAKFAYQAQAHVAPAEKSK